VRPQVWWKEQEAEQLIGDMEQAEVAEALVEAGIEVTTHTQRDGM